MKRASYAWRVLTAVFLLACGISHAVDNDAYSKPVSFQYLNSLDDSPDTSPIVSKVVSYQYFDWPGDENLTFQNSPAVSYYFNGPPRILSQPASQLARVASNVTLSVAVDGTPPLTYQWRFNGQALANNNGTSITLESAEPGDSGIYSVVVSNAFGSVTSADARLIVYQAPSEPQPAPLVLLSAIQGLSSEQTARPIAPTSSQLRILSSATTVDPSKMTIVLTHGWNNSSGDWPSQMASALASGYSTKANILAWDWETDAKINSLNPVPSAGRTRLQGTALANALMNTLGPSYDKPIHFIGHSLGTLVNCTAADYLHGDRRLTIGENRPSNQRYNPLNTHMTLLDEAQLAVPINTLSVSSDILLGKYDLENGQGSSAAKVIPTRAAYVDNYVSEVGLLHDEAANVMLWRRFAVPGISDIPGFGQGLHGYACEWYRQSVLSPSVSAMGFVWSFERGSVSTDPNSATPQKNTFFVQSFDLSRPPLAVSPTSGLAAQMLSRKRLVVYPTLQAYRGLNATGKTIEGVYLNGIQYAGNMVAEFSETFLAPTGTPVYSGTAGSTPQFFLPPGQTTSTNFEAKWDLQFSLKAGSPQPQQLQLRLESTPLNSPIAGPVYTIIPVSIPNEAVGLSFEYSISGSAQDEFMTMGINSSNEFNMEAKFLDDGAWTGTPVIPVSAYRNQEVQLVFALNGDNSSPAGTLGVRNIQFYIPPKPQLEIEKAGNLLTAKWPQSALDWTIETSTDLSDPNGWEAVTQPPTDANFFHSMTFDVTGTNRAFFRLKK